MSRLPLEKPLNVKPAPGQKRRRAPDSIGSSYPSALYGHFYQDGDKTKFFQNDEEEVDRMIQEELAADCTVYKRSPEDDQDPVQKELDEMTRLVDELLASQSSEAAAAEEKKKKTPAPQKVFAIIELLESILSFLPPGAILKSQSVCKDFKNCYEGSNLLQLKTFQRVSDNQAKEEQLNKLLLWQPGEDIYEYLIDGITGVKDIFVGSDHYPLSVTVDFEDLGRGDRTHHSGSWQNLHLTSLATPIILHVTHGMKEVEYADDGSETCVIHGGYAYIRLHSCTLGQMLEIAKKMKAALRHNFIQHAQIGEHHFRAAQDEGKESIYVLIKELVNLMCMRSVWVRRRTERTERRMC